MRANTGGSKSSTSLGVPADALLYANACLGILAITLLYDSAGLGNSGLTAARLVFTGISCKNLTVDLLCCMVVGRNSLTTTFFKKQFIKNASTGYTDAGVNITLQFLPSQLVFYY